MAEGENVKSDATEIVTQEETRSPLEVLFGQSSFALKERQVSVHRVKVRNMKPLLATVRVLLSEIDFKKAQTAEGGADIAGLFDSPADGLAFIENNIDTCLTVITELSDLTLDDVNELDMDELLVVVTNILIINKSFFLTQVLPLFRRAAKTM